MKKNLIFLLVISGLLFVIIYLSTNRNISPNILFLTMPVNNFYGKVEKIDGNIITVTQTFNTSKNKMILYKVLLTDKTNVYRPSGPSIVNTPVDASKYTSKNIRVGYYVNVYTSEDLRTFVGNSFSAISIELPPYLNVLRGKIINLENNVLTVKGLALSSGPPVIMPNYFVPTAPREKEYRINIVSDTEIYKMTRLGLPVPGEPPKPLEKQKLSVADLKKDIQIIIYNDLDIEENNRITALKIELQ